MVNVYHQGVRDDVRYGRWRAGVNGLAVRQGYEGLEDAVLRGVCAHPVYDCLEHCLDSRCVTPSGEARTTEISRAGIGFCVGDCFRPSEEHHVRLLH